MNLLDILLLVLLGIAAVSGFREGFLLEVLSALAFIIGIFVALKLMHVGVDILAETFNASGAWLPLAGFMLIFVGVVLLTRWVGVVLKKVVHATPLGVFDSIGGAVISVFKWALGISVILWGLDAFSIAFPNSWVDDSFMFPYVKAMSDFLWDGVSAILPFLNDFVEDFRDQVNI